ncbi:hypothetical protein BpHYR1_032688 [Brachionus plicatilis]|uniref:Uncharacterized protein n=1 Tax=Brachionus plicatilis TaxID=10195 RepID=A0A3M7R7P6_BRAPC|nr:hypothetical protein BpHYR1_032688 [Brachionus plicatilis]
MLKYPYERNEKIVMHFAEILHIISRIFQLMQLGVGKRFDKTGSKPVKRNIGSFLEPVRFRFNTRPVPKTGSKNEPKKNKIALFALLANVQSPTTSNDQKDLIENSPLHFSPLLGDVIHRNIRNIRNRKVFSRAVPNGRAFFSAHMIIYKLIGVLMIESKGVLYFKLFLEEL